jgi:hypothetical protein
MSCGWKCLNITQNYWVFGLLSIVRYSKNYKIQRFGNWICFRPQVRGETPIVLGPLERANLNHWTTLVKVKVKFTLRLAVYRQSVHLGVKLLETHDQRFFFSTEPLR